MSEEIKYNAKKALAKSFTSHAYVVRLVGKDKRVLGAGCNIRETSQVFKKTAVMSLA